MGAHDMRRARRLAAGTVLGVAAWIPVLSGHAAVRQAATGCAGCLSHDADAEALLEPALQHAALTKEKPVDGQGPDLPALGTGQTIASRLPAGASRIFRLDVPAGHVIQGDFQSGGVMLDLQDRQGAHLRRLSGADASQRSIMWIASTGQQLVVRNTDATSAAFTLTLSKALAPRSHDEADDGPELASPRLRALQEALLSGGSTESFWAEIRRNGSPLIEPISGKESLVTFLWRGDAKNVRLFGSPSGNHDPLVRLGDSDVWWTTFRMPNTARLSYRLAPDVPAVKGSPMEQRRVILATAQRDPFNSAVYPDTADAPVDIYQGSSVLTLPGAPPQPWVTPRPGVERGTLEHRFFDSVELGNRRDVWIYRPANASPEALLVLFDAHAYLDQVPTPVIVDNLMADGLIPPVSVVLVGNPSPEARGAELPPNPRFARFLDKELMPWIVDMGVAQPASRTVIAGSSYGGLASAYAGLTNAHWFGNVLSLSGSYWWAPEGEAPGWMMRQYARAPAVDVRFYLDAGRYEASRGGRDGILETSRHLGDVLRAKNYAVTRVEHDTGHDYLHWQGSLGCGLVALLNPARYAQGLAGCAASIQP